MGYIQRQSRDHMLLLPASVDDYVAADNAVRFIAGFVDDLDLGELSFDRFRPKATGRPGYDPADLLKLSMAISIGSAQADAWRRKPGAISK